MSLAQLSRVFRNVFAALARGGCFLFDLNMEEAYTTQWHKSSAIVADDHVCIIRGGYDPTQRTGQTDITMFCLLDGGWRRADVHIPQRCYSLAEIQGALTHAGFCDVRAYDARRDLGSASDLAIGRTFFLSTKA